MEPDTARQFLGRFEPRALRLPDAGGLVEPAGLVLGKGPNALEVAVTSAAARPTAAALRAIWIARLAGRATPLLLVVLYGGRAALCGPNGERPPVEFDLDPGQVERLCAAALEEPDRHAALRFLASSLPEAGSPLPGIRNEGFFATHFLVTDIPARPDWREAGTRGRGLLGLRGKPLLEGLGLRLEQLPGPAYLVRAAENRAAVAVLLDRGEAPDTPNQRFAGISPLSYAFAKAEGEGVDYVLTLSGPSLRLYPARPGLGVGQRGRGETYFEAHLDLLPEASAGYLWLVFSAAALGRAGSVQDFLRGSADYAVALGARLRDRIYDEVVPPLAQAMIQARNLRRPSAEDLAETYQMALLALFRLLFIAYAEDKDLLPCRGNDLYRARSLKQKAHELVDHLRKGTPFGALSAHWDEAARLFEAVDRGNQEWGVPAYNGGLFSADPAVSPIGAKLATVRLRDDLFGPALAALLVDRTPEGPGPVDFRSLGVREFGTIYEGLLENELALAETDLAVAGTKKGEAYKPAGPKDEVRVRRGQPFLHNTSGLRKSTGSYFTKSFAVEHLLDQGLEPALAEHLTRLDGLDEAKAGEAFFDFRVADLTMGSGHFLVAAVDRIERAFSTYLAGRPLPAVMDELSRLRAAASRALGQAEDDAPAVEDFQLLRRQIARRCIYGVDLNPMAVELARLAIWIHTFVPGLPLSFLDHSLVTGNSLVGIGTVGEANDCLRAVVPESLFRLNYNELLGKAAEELKKLARLSDASAREIKEARAAFAKAKEAVATTRAVLDVLTAARVDAAIRDALGAEVMQAGRASDNGRLEVSDRLHRRATECMSAIPPFHFPIAFPEVFLRERPGFDVIIGNPPWEKPRVEQHSFWARYSPGYHSLKQKERRATERLLRRERPDLVRALEREIWEVGLLRKVLLAGPYPGMGKGDPDTYKAACWRFWALGREGGFVSVVLPRSVLAAKGSEEFRRSLFASAEVRGITTLLNRGGWVFDDAHPQYTISLTSWARRPPSPQAVVPLRGAFASMAAYRQGVAKEPARFPVASVLTWTDTAALPLLPAEGAAEDSAEVFLQLRKAPRLDLDDGHSWRARPHAELHATNDKKLMKFADEAPDGFWPVFKGESFDLWQPDRGEYYGYANPERLLPELQRRRLRSARLARSAFHEFPAAVLKDPGTLPCHAPRIAFRDVARATDTRTMRAALLPAALFVVHIAPFFLWPRGDEADQAFLLGVLSSRPLDWYARRFAEVHITFDVLAPFPIPRPDRADPLWRRCVALAGRLAAPDRRFAKWAKAVGVAWGPLEDDEKADMICELDAVVAHLYGLSEPQLRHIFATFHEGWDYTAPLAATLRHFAKWERRA